MEHNIREDAAKVPEQEASEVNKRLRRRLPDVPLSTYALVDRKNRRLVQVSADNPTDAGDHMDAYYPAEAGVVKIVAAAVKKITARFDLQ